MVLNLLEVDLEKYTKAGFQIDGLVQRSDYLAIPHSITYPRQFNSSVSVWNPF